ncbi:aminotransferase class III-fold pyridoxal phosphate-dependent enzyme [Caloramator australicus]|uniref:aminotransferase class III-fold pyridoxal phosphate-dependent enzyme n=1 Tax=Caloramator australicus TaxID=515264 RepID=UPI0005915F5B|nr:aminotransferase class III-fold pyridoxal phosphate-dependent enzyme [Caloramator australicus]
MGCIIARKVIEVIVEENLIEHGAEMGEYFRRKLSHISERTGAIKEIRERGMMNVVILDKTYRAKKIFKSLLRMGFFIGYSEIFNLLHFYAPLIISTKEIDALCHSLEYILIRQ